MAITPQAGFQLRPVPYASFGSIPIEPIAWHRARYLRRYVQAARRALGAQALPANFRDETINYFDWADVHVNQLDPLNNTSRTGEFKEGSAYHFQNDLDRMKKAFGRLLGSDWPAFKAWRGLHAEAENRLVLRREIRLRRRTVPTVSRPRVFRILSGQRVRRGGL
jgi:hypothetical protein